MSAIRAIALLTDGEASVCLNGVLKGVAAQSTDLEHLFADPKLMNAFLKEAAASLDVPLPAATKAKSENNTAIRFVLVQMAEDPRFAKMLTTYLGGKRPRLIEPVTTALVAAGIIGALSLDVDFKINRRNGKTEWDLKIKKRPTAKKILAKFAGLPG